MGASTGRGGTRKAQQQVRDALLFPGAIVVEKPEVAVPVAWEHFDADGRLTDERRGSPSAAPHRLVDPASTTRAERHNGGVSDGAHGIEAEGLVRTFKGDIQAVDGIDLRVAPGEIFGFLGPNGAGKSTTVHMLTTLLPPTSGTARVAGYDIVKEGPQVRGSIGAALQEAALDNLLDRPRTPAAPVCAPRDPARRAQDSSQELLERVGLTKAADRKVGGYSGGMKRRLDLALALVHRPSILFLDEPTTGLDVQSRSALWDEVARLARTRA